MEIKTAAQMRAENEAPRKAFEKWQEIQMDAIQRANDRKQNRCLFYDSGMYDGQHYEFAHEMKEWLESLGYRIVPTGYIGGVWQLSSDVTW